MADRRYLLQTKAPAPVPGRLFALADVFRFRFSFAASYERRRTAPPFTRASYALLRMLHRCRKAVLSQHDAGRDLHEQPNAGGPYLSSRNTVLQASQRAVTSSLPIAEPDGLIGLQRGRSILEPPSSTRI